MCCWRRIEEIIWAERVKKVEILKRIQEEKNNLLTIKRRMANWIGHVCKTKDG